MEKIFGTIVTRQIKSREEQESLSEREARHTWRSLRYVVVHMPECGSKEIMSSRTFP
jgi:hypothetical protein